MRSCGVYVTLLYNRQFKSSQFYLYNAVHNTQFQSSFTENPDVNVCNILMPYKVSFSRLELGNNNDIKKLNI